MASSGADKGMVRKTPTLEDIHKSIHGLNELVSQTQTQRRTIEDFLLGPSEEVDCGLEKNPESPQGKLEEIEKTITVVHANLGSLENSMRRIVEVLGCCGIIRTTQSNGGSETL